MPGHRGVEALPAGEPVTAEELLAIESATGVAAGAGDVALVRTGYLSGWPDPERLAATRGAGPDVSAARLLLDRGVVATGSDTETYEVQPAPDRGHPANPQPVHTLLLIEHGVYLLESLDLEELAAAGVDEFLFVALPLAIRGATGRWSTPSRSLSAGSETTAAWTRSPSADAERPGDAALCRVRSLRRCRPRSRRKLPPPPTPRRPPSGVPFCAKRSRTSS